MDAQTLFNTLVEQHKKPTLLKYAYALSLWDAALNLGEKSVAGRSETHGVLCECEHEAYLHSGIGETLELLSKKEEALTDWQRAFIRRCRLSWERAQKIPMDLEKSDGEATGRAMVVLKKAENAQDWRLFVPALQEVIRAKQQIARRLVGEHAEDGMLFAALFNEYEPGMTVSELRALFAEVRECRTAVLDRARAWERTDTSVLEETVDETALQKVIEGFPELIGFDRTAGRFDVGALMTYSVGPRDIRIMVEAKGGELRRSLFIPAHELGHGHHHQHQPDIVRWTDSLSFIQSASVSETFAILWDMFVFRSREFVDFLFPKLQEAFPHLRDVSPERFFRDLHQPNLTGSTIGGGDLITFCLRQVISSEVSMDLIGGKLSPAEVIRVTEERLEEMLGEPQRYVLKWELRAPHFAIGYFGYIPTYLIAFLAAAQIAETYKHHHPSWKEEWRKGNLQSLQTWLIDHVYPWCDVENINQFLTRITGNPLGTAAWLRSLEELST